jgi:hypothetical protein
MHQKRIYSMAMAVWGILHSHRLSSSQIGLHLAQQRGTMAKHQIKQVDRLLGNTKLEVSKELPVYIRWLIGVRKSIVISLDWTSFGTDKQSTIMVNLVTRHGRSTPLAWKTVKDSRLKHRRNSYEREVLTLVWQALLGLDVKVIVLADRGFFDTKFFGFIRESLGWDYIIWIKQNAKVTTETISRREIRSLTASNGRITELVGAQLTDKGYTVGSVVTVKAAKMKEAWHLATSLASQKERVVKLYGRRFCCEEHYRDTKDDRFGMGLKETHVTTVERRDRFLLFHAIATVLLTLLGAAGEKLSLDRLLRVNTITRRTHSLYYQGKQYLLGAVHAKFKELQACFEALLTEHKTVTETEWVI